MFERLDPICRSLLRDALVEARRLAASEAGPEHLLLAALVAGEPVGSVRVLVQQGLSAASMRSWLSQQVEPWLLDPGRTAAAPLPSMTKDVARAVGAATRLSLQRRESQIAADLVIFALLDQPAETLQQLLVDLGQPAHVLAAALSTELGLDEASELSGASFANRRAARTPRLDEFGTDLVALARSGRLDPYVGRVEQIEHMISVLLRRTKNNPVIIGAPGVGKTAIVEALAQRIADGEVPDELASTTVLAVDTGALLSGTRHRGDFEERVRKLLEITTSSDSRVVLFIDEIHQVLGAGGTHGNMDLAALLKPALSRGGLSVIGATTTDEYRQIFEKDAALARRFQSIEISAASVSDTELILTRLAPRLSTHHGVSFSPPALTAAARLADRFVPERALPDAAIDVLDEAAAALVLSHAHLDDESRLEAETALKEIRAGALANPPSSCLVDVPAIERTIAAIARIPLDVVALDAAATLANLPQLLTLDVVGQPDITTAVGRAVLRRRAGLGDHRRPVSILCAGPSGVGKTELARSLARHLYGSVDALISIDMSEYMEPHTVSRLIGAPPGYAGYDEPGQLTEPLRRRRACVLLLDEIDKADQKVCDILLQLLEEGRVTDGAGRAVDATDVVVIATCNVAGTAPRRTGFTTAPALPTEAEVRTALALRFRPELLNRFDEVLHFAPLDHTARRTIAARFIDRVALQLAERGVEIHIDDSALDHIADLGTDPDMGARPMRRTVQDLVESPIAELLIAGLLPPGSHVTCALIDGKVSLWSDVPDSVPARALT